MPMNDDVARPVLRMLAQADVHPIAFGRGKTEQTGSVLPGDASPRRSQQQRREAHKVPRRRGRRESTGNTETSQKLH